MRPIKTEKKLIQKKQQLTETELLRQHAVDKLTQAEQKILQQAEEIERYNILHTGELSEHQQLILDMADKLNQKVKEFEMAEIKLKEVELVKQQMSNQLNKQEKDIIQQAKLIQENHEKFQQELSQKEQDILNQSQELQQKQKNYEETKLKLEQLQLEKDEINTELSYKEKQILEKTQELEEKSILHQEQMTKKEKEIMQMGEDLEKKRQKNKNAKLQLQESLLKIEELENQLTLKEQQILQQAEDLLEKQQQHKQQLTDKEQEILNQAVIIEHKNILHEQAVQEISQIQLQINDIKNELTMKEQEIINQKNKLEDMQNEMDEVLSQKELEIIQQGNALEEKSKLHVQLQYQLNKLECSEQEKILQLQKIEKDLQDNTKLIDQKTKQIDSLQQNAQQFYKFNIKIISAQDLYKSDVLSENDPFVIVKIGHLQAQTKVIDNTAHPSWNESFQFYCDFIPSYIIFQIFDEDPDSFDSLGESQINWKFDENFQNKDLEYNLDVLRHNKHIGNLKVTVKFQKIMLTQI